VPKEKLAKLSVSKDTSNINFKNQSSLEKNLAEKNKKIKEQKAELIDQKQRTKAAEEQLHEKSEVVKNLFQQAKSRENDISKLKETNEQLIQEIKHISFNKHENEMQLNECR